MKIIAININATEWFDRINGNSYFTANVQVIRQKNKKADPEEINIYVPFHSGYDSHYQTIAFQQLEKDGIIKDIEHYDNGGHEPIWRYCQRKKIITNFNKSYVSRKKDLI